MAENHKFFNFFLLFGSMISAYVLVIAWKKSIIIRPLVIITGLFLLLSGIIDFFPIYNDSKLALTDYPNSEDIKWIMKNTPTNATILNTTYLYDTASIAGRRIFLGWPYFPWSAGFDTTKRSNQIKQFFMLQNRTDICIFLTINKLDYLSLTTPTEDFPFNSIFWDQHFSPQYTNPQTNLRIYKTNDICKQI